MIIFYNKNTGEIKGTVEGRIHDENHLKMWIGDKNETNRLIVNFIPSKYYDKDGNEIPEDCLDACDEEGNLLRFSTDFEPNHQQKDLFVLFDSKPSEVYKYSIDPKTKMLKLKEK